MYIYY